MYFTTQKQQVEAYRQLLRAERIALCKRVLTVIIDCAICGLIITLPTVGIALGWLKG